tara:strand:- start:22150 stop:22437 length:288 start_codon:yes stop_codon:yes gene_type:complete
MSIKKPSTLTVVYTINNNQEFKEERGRIFSNFTNDKGLPWAITAVSGGHSLQRLALIEEALENDRNNIAKELINITNPEDYDDIYEYIDANVRDR